MSRSIELLAVDDRHPELLRLGGVEQHAFHSAFPGADPRRACRRRRSRTAARSRGVERYRRRTRAKTTAPAAVAAGGREQVREGMVRSASGVGLGSGGASAALVVSACASCMRSSGRAPAAVGRPREHRERDRGSRGRKSRLVRRAMRRFEPAASRVRRLRSSFTIATFPGRNARTVEGFNRRPVHARMPRPSLPRSAAPSPGRSGARHPPMTECAAIRQRSRLRIAPWPSVLQATIIKQMNELSKDAVNWLAVGEDGDGPARRQFPGQDSERRPEEPHLPDPAQRRGAGEQAAGSGRTRGLPSGDRRPGPADRASAPRGKPGAGRIAPRSRCPPILFEDDALIALDKPAGPRGPRRQRHRVRRDRAAARGAARGADSSSSSIGSIATRRACCSSPRSARRSTGLHAQLRDGAIDKRYDVLVRGRWRDAMRARRAAAAQASRPSDGERRVRVDDDGRLARDRSFAGAQVWPRARSAAGAARGGARDRAHAPDPRASHASRISAGRRRQVRRLRVEQGARAARAEADVPARARASASRIRSTAASWSSRRRCRRDSPRYVARLDAACRWLIALTFAPRRYPAASSSTGTARSPIRRRSSPARCSSACRDLGEPVPDESTARFVIGLGLADALRHVAPALPRERHPELAARYRQHYLAREDDDSAVRRRARDAGRSWTRRATCSASRPARRARASTARSAQQGVRALLRRDALRRRGLPEAASRHAAAPDGSSSASSPRETLMIGDTTHDLELARNAGVDALAVAYGAHEPEGLARQRPLATVHSIAELRAWLARTRVRLKLQACRSAMHALHRSPKTASRRTSLRKQPYWPSLTTIATVNCRAP